MAREITIGIKPDAPKTKITELKEEIQKTRDAAKETGAEIERSIKQRGGDAVRATDVAVTNLGRGFQSMGRIIKEQMRQSQAETEKLISDIVRLQRELDVARMKSGNVVANQRAATARAMATIGLPQPGASAAAATPSMGAGAASLASRAAGPAVVVAAGKQMMESADRWTSLDNSVQRFVRTGETSMGVLRQQKELAHELRVEMEDSIPVFDAVTDATDQMFLTRRQQIEVTKTLGEQFIIEGKSIGEVARMMDTLGYAMSIGHITGRELKGIMKEMPEIADLWTEQLGVTRKELLNMADSGTLDVRQLVTAIADGGDAIHEKFNKRAKTMGDHVREAGDAIGEALPTMEQLKRAAQEQDPVWRTSMELWERGEMFLKRLEAEANRLTFGIGALTKSMLENVAASQLFVAGQNIIERSIAAFNKAAEVAKARADAYKQVLKEIAADVEMLPDHDTDVANKLFNLEAKQAANVKAAAVPDLEADLLTIQPMVDEMDAKLALARDYTAQWREEMAKLAEESNVMMPMLRDGLGEIAEQLVLTATSGKLAWEDFGRSIAAVMLKLLATGVFNAISGQSAGPGGGSGGFFSGLPGFASGGMINPGGTGSTDSQIVAFRKSPDETVRVTTPSQEAVLVGGAQGGAGGMPAMNIHNHFDHDAFGSYVRSPAGERDIVNIMRRNAPQTRGFTDGR
jgi:tape measure domain-containing protein